MVGRAGKSLRERPGTSQVFSKASRREDSLRPVHPRSRHQAADARTAARFTSRPRRSSCWRRSSWIVRKSCPRLCCSNVSGPRRSSPRPTSRTSWPRFARRSATGPAPRCSSGPRTGSATRSAGTPPPLPAAANGTRIDPRAGSSGAGGAFLCQPGNTSSDAIPMSRSGSTHRRSPAVTRGWW